MESIPWYCEATPFTDKRTAQKDFGGQITRREICRRCCVDPLRPPRKADIGRMTTFDPKRTFPATSNSQTFSPASAWQVRPLLRRARPKAPADVPATAKAAGSGHSIALANSALLASSDSAFMRFCEHSTSPLSDDRLGNEMPSPSYVAKPQSALRSGQQPQARGHAGRAARKIVRKACSARFRQQGVGSKF